MAETVVNPLWYRLAPLKPRLRAHVRVRQRLYRGQPWFLLCDTLGGRYHLLDEAAFAIVGRLNGERTLQQIWDLLNAKDPLHAPTQTEVIAVLVNLGNAELLNAGVMPDLDQESRNRRTSALRQRFASLNPLSFRVPLFNPAPVLSRIAPFFGWMFTPGAVAAWLLLVITALLVAGSHFDELAAVASETLFSSRALLIGWIAYPLMKLVHETAHGVAVHHWKGEVRQCGVSFLLLVPVPWVDASAATAFSRTSQRVLVSAAGIMTELALAALAILLWVSVEPGFIRDGALIVAVMGSISTVLVNANPLMRFDGYHMLCDLLALPNLGRRSSEYCLGLMRRKLLGVAGVENTARSGWERGAFLAYAPAAWVYQTILSATAVFWVADHTPVVAVALLALLTVLLLVRPLWRAGSYLVSSPELTRQRTRSVGIAAAVAAGLVAIVAFLPLPMATTVDGVVWVPERALVRANVEGFVSRIHVRDGQLVKPGQVLVTLENDEIDAQLEDANSKLTDARADYWRAVQDQSAQAQRAAADVERWSQAVAQIEQRRDQLQLRASVAGRFVLANPDDVFGAFAQKGQVLAHVMTGSDAIVRVAVPQDRAVLVRSDTHSVSARALDDPRRRWVATLSGDVPQAGYEVPTAALSTAAGGEILVDPRDEKGLRTREAVAVADVALEGYESTRLGGRVLVRFSHSPQPLGVQLLRGVRQLLLRHFDGGRPTGDAAPNTVTAANRGDRQ